MKKANLPNAITLLRVVLSTGLILIDYHSILFISGYLICGLTDLLDGFIARKMNCESSLGARLDSIADFFMCSMIIITLIKQNQITIPIFVIVIVILTIRVVNAVISKVKFNSISSIHTMANKLTGVLLFFCPISFSFSGNHLLYTAGILAFVSSVEESLIFISSKTLDLNRKSIFSKE